MDPSEPGTVMTECEEDQASAPRSEALGSEMGLVCSPEIRSCRATRSGRATRSVVASEEDGQEHLVPSWEPTG
jgi:hypothetical protein